MNVQSSRILDLMTRLDIIREARHICLLKIQALLASLSHEDHRICACAIEEEELLAQIHAEKNNKINEIL
jgi:hypothetical protein